MWTQIRLLLQEQSDLGPHCLSMRLQIFQWATKTYDFLWSCALRVNKCEFWVHTVRIFMKCTHILRGQNNLFTLHQIVEPRPYMIIKVTAFTVPQKSYNMLYLKPRYNETSTPVSNGNFDAQALVTHNLKKCIGQNSFKFSKFSKNHLFKKYGCIKKIWTITMKDTNSSTNNVCRNNLENTPEPEVDTQCGYGRCKLNFLQKFNNPKFLLVLLCIYSFSQGNYTYIFLLLQV